MFSRLILNNGTICPRVAIHFALDMSVNVFTFHALFALNVQESIPRDYRTE